MQENRDDFTQMKFAWWLHPVAIFVGLNGLTAAAAFLADPGTYLDLWRTPKYFNGFTVLLTVAALAVFSAGVWLTRANQSSLFSQPEWRGTISFSRLLLLFNISFWVSIMAYVFWLARGISRGLGLALLKSVFTGGAEIYTLRDSLQTVPGITTLTQLGMAAVVLGCLIGSGGGWRIVWRKLAILSLLALLRAVLYSERLAFLELAIPFLVLWLAEPASGTRSRGLRTLIRIAPVLGAAGVYVVFTSFEYFRSWSIYYSSRESSLLLFGFWRLVGYYVTAFNNSAYLLSSLHHSLGAPYFSFSFLWDFPMLNVLVKDVFSWVHLDYDGYMGLLALGANPEFNNPGGLLSPIVDLGVLGGLAYWAVMGLVTGYLYNLYTRKHPLGMCIYPVVFLALTEVPRYIYWGEGRAFPALAYLLLSATVLLSSATFCP
ncbi:MAG: oligosaccharide repeat unit polymerase [Candidatus Acidiferrales bacterium]|jgi:oligosaccharide repeat unit polymerase